MTVERIHPESHFWRPNFSHVVATQGGRTLYIAGQVARNKEGQSIGAGDFDAQAVKVFENLRDCLAAGGATAADIVKIVTYVMNYTDGLRDRVNQARAKVFGADAINAAGTLVGVQALAQPEFLIEVEAIAVVNGD